MCIRDSKELEERIAYYQELLGSETMIRQVLKDELTAIRDKYGDERVTEIQDVEDEIDIEDLIEEAVSYTHLDVYKRQMQDRQGSPYRLSVPALLRHSAQAGGEQHL